MVAKTCKRDTGTSVNLSSGLHTAFHLHRPLHVLQKQNLLNVQRRGHSQNVLLKAKFFSNHVLLYRRSSILQDICFLYRIQRFVSGLIEYACINT